MKLDELFCPCGAPVDAVQVDAGVFLRCADGCPLVEAPPAPSVAAAMEAWLAAQPPPSIDDALETFAYNSAGALVHAQTPAELVHLAPLAQTLISYLQFLSTQPRGD